MLTHTPNVRLRLLILIALASEVVPASFALVPVMAQL